MADQGSCKKLAFYFGFRAMTCRSEKLRNQYFLFRNWNDAIHQLD